MKLRLILVALGVMAYIAPAQAQYTYAGRGTGLDVNVLSLVNIRVADTGPLSPSGGTLAVSAGSANLTSSGATVVSTGILSSQTVGGAGAVNSFALVNGLRIFPGIGITPDLVSATVVRSDASATWGSFGGSSTITSLMVLGSSVTVTGAANQIYSIPGVLDLTINRQTVSGGVLRVDALYLSILDPARAGKIAVSTSYAGLVPEPSSACLVGLALPGILCITLRRRGRISA
ncbi:MAG: choice-of-anchor P family protein [Armatimonas sp.]